jgi:hypothetical protein
MAIQRRYYGRLVIELWEDDSFDQYGKQEYHGRIKLPDGHTWKFNKLACFGGFSHAAETAITFGAYYSTHNRGDDVPEWAPPPEIADIIENECDYWPDFMDLVEINGVEVVEEKVICETRAAQKEFYALCEKAWDDAHPADDDRNQGIP